MTFLTLEPANGPSCPKCGCRDVRILQYPPEPGPDGKSQSWWAQGRARCRHCGLSFAFRELPEPLGAGVVNSPEDIEPDELETTEIRTRDVAYPVRQCPECGSPNTYVVSSGKKPAPDRPRIRHHRCKDCPAKFKSVDCRHIKGANPLRLIS